ncbi:crossover junction endodeoxyribonuclease RuvC [Magnetococcus sp. PR-3]|uniref:crossover junction endodeoxyribonuclease RuvC n=1 Tax=Magnetococcus sp. PR-3 TaxID=3120355 RepID=UPI002FCDEA71
MTVSSNVPTGKLINNAGAILALDLGTQMGWALHHPDGTIVSGTMSFKLGRFEGGGMQWVRFKAWLDEMTGTVPLGQIYFEEVRRHIGTTAAHVYGGFLAHLTEWAENSEVPYQGVPVGTIKKSATGKGNASKAQVIHAMKRLGHQPADDNESDALALLHYVLGTGGAR